MGKNNNGRTEAAAHPADIAFKLGQVPITLTSNAAVVGRNAVQFLSDSAFIDNTAEISPGAIHLHLELVRTLPPPPDRQPIFTGESHHLPDGVGTLQVYQQPDGFTLSFQKGGLVHIRPNSASPHDIQGFITTDLLKYGRLHDLLFTTLAPYLRRRGCYLIHASAAVSESGAALFVGGPGCGKSTTVLNLALNKWGLLSDDTLILNERPDGIYALPTPGGFSIRAKSIAHLPALTTYVPSILPGDFYYLSPQKLGLAYASPTRISTIYFSQVSHHEGETQKHPQPLPPAIAFAHLLEFSLDRWDKTTLPAHITFLQKLNAQAQAYALKITNQHQLPPLLR